MTTDADDIYDNKCFTGGQDSLAFAGLQELVNNDDLFLSLFFCLSYFGHMFLEVECLTLWFSMTFATGLELG